MSDETKGPAKESEQLTPDELAKVAGGAAAAGGSPIFFWYCSADGTPMYSNGEGRSMAYRYDEATRSCIKV
jgi:hypothetical protein